MVEKKKYKKNQSSLKLKKITDRLSSHAAIFKKKRYFA